MNPGVAYWELIASKLKGLGWQMSITVAHVHGAELSLIDARQDGIRFVVLADDRLAGLLELEADIKARS